MKNKKLLTILFLAVLILTAGFGLKSCTEKKEQLPDPVDLVYWRLWDDRVVFDPIIEAYQAQNPHVTITYKKLTYAEYEKAVVDALASGKGPDIWSIHNTWLPKHIDKLEPAKEEILPIESYKEAFADVVSSDFIDPVENKIYGVPLSIDTLALYYNKDLFNNAFVIAPPKDWTEMQEIVPKLTKTDDVGDISRSAVAMGTASNVDRGVDILNLLMLQNNTQMTSPDGKQATFNLSSTTSTGETFFPGVDALEFYTQFADPKRKLYTWTPVKSQSVDAFVAEEVAMIFSYSYQDAVIKGKSPKLNYAIAKVPQIKNTPKEINYANYWGEVVSKSSEHKDEAWKFLAYLASNEASKQYAESTKRPAARKDLIQEQLEDPTLKVFAGQALTAKSWYQKDPAAIDNIFAKMIESVILGEAEVEDAISSGTQQVTATMQ